MQFLCAVVVKPDSKSYVPLVSLPLHTVLFAYVYTKSEADYGVTTVSENLMIQCIMGL